MIEIVDHTMETPQNNYDALVLALELAVTAPNEDASNWVTATAELIASQMEPLEVARAKRQVEKKLEEGRA